MAGKISEEPPERDDHGVGVARQFSTGAQMGPRGGPKLKTPPDPAPHSSGCDGCDNTLAPPATRPRGQECLLCDDQQPQRLGLVALPAVWAVA